MISMGRDCVFEEQSRVKKQKSVDVIVWEVVSAKYMLQMKYLATGNAWVNNASLNKVIQQYIDRNNCEHVLLGNNFDF